MTVLAVDLGATWLRVSPFSGAPLGKSVYRLSEIGLESVPEIIASAGKELKAEAIGIATAGPLSLKDGWIRPPNLGNVKLYLRNEVEALSGIRVYMQNDCVAGLLATILKGDAGSSKNVVYITFSTGIGAGVMVDGHVILGKDGNAHEVGHLVLSYSGDIRCGCGGLGHWEALCGGKNMVEHFRLKAGVNVHDARDIFELARLGDPRAIAFTEECMRINAAGIASVVNSYDPEVVVLSGSVFLGNREQFINGISKYIGDYLINRPPVIKPSSLGDDAPLIGAGLLAELKGVLP